MISTAPLIKKNIIFVNVSKKKKKNVSKKKGVSVSKRNIQKGKFKIISDGDEQSRANNVLTLSLLNHSHDYA